MLDDNDDDDESPQPVPPMVDLDDDVGVGDNCAQRSKEFVLPGVTDFSIDILGDNGNATLRLLALSKIISTIGSGLPSSFPLLRNTFFLSSRRCMNVSNGVDVVVVVDDDMVLFAYVYVFWVGSFCVCVCVCFTS